jgi:mono/diheme cytochrome c family protein
MPTVRFTFAVLIGPLLILTGALARGGPAATPGFRDIAQPFIQKHCTQCHGEKKAQAGFRIDLLTGDFAAAKMAEHWKEVIDRINAGEMPPKARPSISNCAMSNWRPRTRAAAFPCAGSIAMNTPTPYAIS